MFLSVFYATLLVLNVKKLCLEPCDSSVSRAPSLGANYRYDVFSAPLPRNLPVCEPLEMIVVLTSILQNMLTVDC